MAVLNRGVTAGLQGSFRGLLPGVHDWLIYQGPMSYKAAATNNVFTKGGVVSTINASSAAGTAVDFPRNLQYQMSMTGGTASGTVVSAGTLAVYGLIANGSTASESVAFTSLASQSTAVQGTVCFAQVNTISFSNFLLATAGSTNSASISLSIGVGNKVGSPIAIKQNGQSAYPTPIPFAYIGTSVQTTVSATSATSNNVFTIVTGSVGIAGLSLSNALATNTPIGWFHQVNR